MTETRKKLTDTQFKYLIDAQLTYNNALGVLKEANSNLDKIRVLVLDAHGLEDSTAISIDPKSQELVIEEEDSVEK